MCFRNRNSNGNVNFRYRLLSLIIFFCILIHGVTEGLYASENKSSSDSGIYELRDALLSGKFQEFKRQLLVGSDPTKWLDNSWNGWVFCAATDKGRGDFLKLIIDLGFDVNYRQSDITSELSTPLLCAITFKNLEAVKYLVRSGADPREPLCLECNTAFSTSALWSAALDANYDIANWLIKNADYNVEQLQAVVTILERIPFPKDAHQYDNRDIFVENLRAKGISVTPWAGEDI